MTKQGSANHMVSKFMMAGMALAVLLLAGCTPSDFASISPKEASTLLSESNAIIVDVREDSEWKELHIAGAIHIPLAQVEARVSELAQYKDSKVILQCRSGKRSAKAASMLQRAGFTKVYNLTGGIIAWDKEGLATTKSSL